MKKFFVWLGLVLGLVVTLAGISAQPAQAADNSLARVKEKGTLVMGTSPDYPPYEFLVNRNGKERVVGMDVDIAKKIAKDLGVKLVIKQMSFDSLLVALETNKVDMVVSGMSPTPAREKSVDFSKVYYKGGQSILINKTDKGLYHDKNSFINKAVGAQTGSIQYSLGKKQIKNSTVKGLDKISDLILALKSHKVEGVIMEKPSAQAYVDNDKSLTMINGNFNLGKGENDTAIGFRKGSTSLVNEVNKSVDQIDKQGLTKDYLKDAGSYMKTNTHNTTMWHYAGYFAKGVGYTLLITVISVFFGILLGIIFALMRLSKNKLLHGLGVAYIEFVRGTPLMIQVMFVYFGIGLFINIPALTSGIIAVSLNSAAYVAEIIRGGINSVAKGQTEAARSLGLSNTQTFRSVVFPQALKNIWPALGNEFVSLIKESSIVSIIGVTDLIYQLKAVQTATYKGVAPIIVAMILYFIMTFSLSKVLNHYERSMRHD
ncbi:ABC transporter substrate-binding protein/permease [Loigolactobacillus iwatensis]|uniref:ABC transporter substrate-binding protein/permease n=1 Tax=Loigolactobacillus iwatensis TaxID=1267156 RepID=UPI000F7E7A37|nr:ABC transporter substrate-binding protein/permease [Loigolactobacillus iwatensis]